MPVPRPGPSPIAAWTLFSGNDIMNETLPPDTIIDFVSGRPLPNVGAEANRQAVEAFLVNRKEYAKTDVEVNAAIKLTVGNKPYQSRLDLVVSVDGTRFMLIKCAAGSLGSRERESLAAARLFDAHQIPLTVVSDGRTAIVLDTVSGKKIGEGLDAVPTREEARRHLKATSLQPLPDKRREKEQLIFRSYDMMNVNVG